MKITNISYQEVKNTGNYESRRLEATAELAENEDASIAVVRLKDWVRSHLDDQQPAKGALEDF